jgi:hypothetical protein
MLHTLTQTAYQREHIMNVVKKARLPGDTTPRRPGKLEQQFLDSRLNEKRGAHVHNENDNPLSAESQENRLKG